MDYDKPLDSDVIKPVNRNTANQIGLLWVLPASFSLKEVLTDPSLPEAKELE